MFFDALAVQVDGPTAWNLDIALRWVFPTTAGPCSSLHNGALTYGNDRPGDVTATITVAEGCPRPPRGR